MIYFRTLRSAVLWQSIIVVVISTTKATTTTTTTTTTSATIQLLRTDAAWGRR